MIPSLETKRLILRGVELTDAVSWQKNFAHFEIIRHLSAAVPWPYPEDGAEFFIKHLVLPEQGKTRWCWGIFLKSDLSELVGAVELFHPGKPENRGFWLARKCWNQGLMTEAVGPVMDFAFTTLNLESLTFANAVGNTRSRRVKEKTGATWVENLPAKLVDPAYKESEYWKLTKEAWLSRSL